jgi:hypothetical protein
MGLGLAAALLPLGALADQLAATAKGVEKSDRSPMSVADGDLFFLPHRYVGEAARRPALRGLRASRRAGEGRGRHEARDVREFRHKAAQVSSTERVASRDERGCDARRGRARIRSSGARRPALGVS